jgi:hypothetical protein
MGETESDSPSKETVLQRAAPWRKLRQQDGCESIIFTPQSKGTNFFLNSIKQELKLFIYLLLSQAIISLSLTGKYFKISFKYCI